MNPIITVDNREWIRAARQLHETSSRSCVDFINGQALRVASLAVKLTKAADPRKIEHQLGAVGRSVSFKTLTRGKNKGRMRAVRGGYTLASEDTLGHRILTTRLRITKSWGIRGETMAERVKNLIKARVASVNFIRAGWIPAIKKLSMIVRRRPPGAGLTVSGARQRGVPKGDATAAAFSLRSVMQSTIWNSALTKIPAPPEGKGEPLKYARAGLDAALRVATIDMMDTLAKRLRPDLKRVSVK